MLPSAIVFAGVIALAVAAFLHAARPWLHGAVLGAAPQARARWLFGILAAPITTGVVVVLIAVGHCLVPRLLGLEDDCIGASLAGCAFCLFSRARGGPLAWALAAFTLFPLLRQLVTSARALLSARRARERLRTIARPGPHGSWHVPGAGAFVVGWREPVVCIGESLTAALDDRCLQAVSAHEDEHRSRGDLWLRSAARILAAGHLPATRQELLDALDLATEQACDERAGEVVADRLVVAQALLDAARLQVGGGHCLPAALDARVTALCALPTPDAAAPWAPRVALALAATLAASLWWSHQVHRVAENFSLLLTR